MGSAILTSARVVLGRDAVVLDRYRIVEPIAGGSNQMYLGTDERLWRPVCVKVFVSPEAPAGIALAAYEHFVQEAYALSTLGHPNTVRIYDFGHLRGAGGEVPFQVLEYLDGGTLAEAVRTGGPLRGDDACRVILGLGGALAEAHARGLVHRDVKSPNVMFHGRGRARAVKLVDFGIAKALDPEARAMPLPAIAEDTGVVAGGPVAMYSANWSAPEQLLGEPVDVTADIYSFALVVVHLLTGRMVFRAQGLDDALAQRRDTGPRIAEALATIPQGAAITALLQRACAFSAAARPTAIAELAAEIVAGLDADVDTGPVTRAEPVLATDTEAAPVATLDAATLDAAPATPEAAPAPPEAAAEPAPAAPVPDRRVHALAVDPRGAALTCGGHGARVHVGLVAAGYGGRHLLTLRGLNCFVGVAGSRPTSAVQVGGDCDVTLLTPELRSLGRARVRFARDGAVELDGALLAVPAAPTVALDFGGGEDCIVVTARSSP